MAEKIFLLGLRFFIFFGFVTLALLILLASPYEGNNLEVENKFIIFSFYVIVFIFLFSCFSGLLFSLRKKFWTKQDLLEAHIGVSLRQGFLLAIAFVLMLFFQSLRILVWWDALLVLGALFVVELYFLSR